MTFSVGGAPEPSVNEEIEFLTLYANDKGEVFEHPEMGLLGRTLDSWVVPESEEMIPLPRGASLVMVPEHYPVGLNAANGESVCLQENPLGESGRVYAVGALLPQGFTRTYLPAGVVGSDQGRLPLLGYAAVGFKDGEIYVAAVQTDEHHKWHPHYYNSSGLEKRINRRLQSHTNNRILHQLAYCALNYSCFTAQNIFYERWEGGIPSMPGCNASCIGCISQQHGPAGAPQDRLDFVPETWEVVEVGMYHLARAQEGIISFGQGCEGEPALNHACLAPAIQTIRQEVDGGTINMNTNAGFTSGIKEIVDAGLDAMRVTIFSCIPDHYNIYHCPQNYSLNDVEASIAYACSHGVYVSLNLLTFPGFTDREEEVESLVDFVRRNDIDMVQLRNLNLDPDHLAGEVPYSTRNMGIKEFINVLQGVEGLRIGSYTHPVAENL
ncbi:MAG: radical SAM protein [Syntrophothermaceae bacterium]